MANDWLTGIIAGIQSNDQRKDREARAQEVWLRDLLAQRQLDQEAARLAEQTRQFNETFGFNKQQDARQAMERDRLFNLQTARDVGQNLLRPKVNSGVGNSPISDNVNTVPGRPFWESQPPSPTNATFGAAVNSPMLFGPTATPPQVVGGGVPGQGGVDPFPFEAVPWEEQQAMLVKAKIKEFEQINAAEGQARNKRAMELYPNNPTYRNLYAVYGDKLNTVMQSPESVFVNTVIPQLIETKGLPTAMQALKEFQRQQRAPIVDPIAAQRLQWEAQDRKEMQAGRDFLTAIHNQLAQSPQYLSAPQHQQYQMLYNSLASVNPPPGMKVDNATRFYAQKLIPMDRFTQPSTNAFDFMRSQGIGVPGQSGQPVPQIATPVGTPAPQPQTQPAPPPTPSAPAGRSSLSYVAPGYSFDWLRNGWNALTSAPTTEKVLLNPPTPTATNPNAPVFVNGQWVHPDILRQREAARRGQ